MFCEESLGKIKFRDVGPRITLEQVNTTEWLEKNNDLKVTKLRWSGVVKFHCMQMRLVMSIRLIFGDD